MDRRQYLKSALTLGGGLLLPVGISALAGCNGTARDPELAAFDGRIMGTSYSVRIAGQAPVELGDRIHARLAEVDARMSTWRTDSELSLFNVSQDTDWQAMSAGTTAVVSHAARASARSAGAFDATVGPLVDLWGFGAGSAHRASTRPRAQDIRHTQALVGHTHIEIDLQQSALRKRRPGAQLDLSGIAKGHAVDRVAHLLDQEGYDSYLVEVGGELRSRGRKSDGLAWRVAIERPGQGPRRAHKVIELDTRAIATSGNYRHFFDEDANRYSHAIDPRTGKPVEHQLASVTVIADTTMAADALSTSLMIMGPEEGRRFAEQYGIAAYMITRQGKSLVEHSSSRFGELEFSVPG